MNEIEWVESGWPLLENGSCDRSCKELALFAYSDALGELDAGLRKELFPPDGGEWNAKRSRNEEARRPAAFPGCLVLRFDPRLHRAFGRGLVLSLHESRMESSRRSFMRSVWFVLPATWSKNPDARAVGAACELLLRHRGQNRRGFADRVGPLALDRALGDKLRNPKLTEQGSELRALHDTTPSELMMALVQYASDFRLLGSKLAEHLDKGLAAFCLPSTTDAFSLAVSFENATLSPEWRHPIPLASYLEREVEPSEGGGAGSSAFLGVVRERSGVNGTFHRASDDGAADSGSRPLAEHDARPQGQARHRVALTPSRFDERRRKALTAPDVIQAGPRSSNVPHSDGTSGTATSPRPISSATLGVLIGLASLQIALLTCHMIESSAHSEPEGQPGRGSEPAPPSEEAPKPAESGSLQVWRPFDTVEGSVSRVVALEEELGLPLFVRAETDSLGRRLSAHDEERVELVVHDVPEVVAVAFVMEADPCVHGEGRLHDVRSRVAELLPGIESDDVLLMEQAYGLPQGVLVTSAERAEGWRGLQSKACHEKHFEPPTKNDRWDERK